MVTSTSALPGTTILNLPLAPSLDGSEFVPLVQGGVTKRTASRNITTIFSTPAGFLQAATGNLAYYTSSAAINGSTYANLSSGSLTLGLASSATGKLLLASTGSGTTTITPSSATVTITLPSATTTLVGTNTTDTLTNKTMGAHTLSGTISGGGNQINNVIIGTSQPLAALFTDVTVASVTATPAGGSSLARMSFGTTANFGVYYGSGAPTVTAPQGSLYLRSDGTSSATRMYVNSSGSSVWTAVITVA